MTTVREAALEYEFPAPHVKGMMMYKRCPSGRSKSMAAGFIRLSSHHSSDRKGLFYASTPLT